MDGKTVTFSGWKAMVVLVILASFAGFRIATARSKLDTQGRAALERWVQAELVRSIVADTTKSLAERGAAAAEASAVTIRSIAVRGPLSNAVVRVELNPSPALPPGAESGPVLSRAVFGDHWLGAPRSRDRHELVHGRPSLLREGRDPWPANATPGPRGG